MKLSLNDQIISTEDLRAVIKELRDYAKWCNHNAVKLKVLGKKDGAKVELSVETGELMHQWQADKPLSSALMPLRFLPALLAMSVSGTRLAAR